MQYPDHIHTELFFKGGWRTSVRTEAVLDKYTLEPAGTVSIAGKEEIGVAVAAALAAHRAGAPSPAERAQILERAIPLVAERREDFRTLMAIEAGFPCSDADGEIDRCQETLRLSAMAARELAGEMVPMSGSPQGQGRIGFTHRVPVGPVLAITPFNSPLNTVTHKVAPAFAAGNPVVLKPSLHTPATAALLIEILAEAGVPEGFLAILHGGVETAELLIAEEAIRYIAFTGSTAAGRAIQGRAGLRRTQMELGSIASTVLCADADLNAAVPKVVSASFRKAGQVCSSIQLLHVHSSILDTVLERLIAGAKAMVVGDPRDAATVVGPLVSLAAAERVERWVQEAEGAGARLLTPLERSGACLRPIVLTGVAADMRVTCEEIFGPVVSVLPFDDFEEVIARANASPFGLAAGVFTNRLDIVRRAIDGLDVGGLHFNETSSSRIDLMPYGGVKQSGFGQEGPKFAVREMTEERLVTMRL
ncbi:succinate-semialdehyde dehydrogenase/glutarate-semialdehyde dehydrogenase [Rhizobium azooxidifex]|uniref:Succinate-semialdehyde dehydrogenase/glutarate-semialdehyde dehydrogenase n=1 Tax=Mycoplana azooxidifex TaxID=1636188 RepID=A0A7W6DBI9_9HYPH|nr:aldehyde dehydrogenase family protein [Mycoplana azooxidifex]MBB3979627.1 succinate-semialdehyde dehydrogenase/glutarate-semialdehyde dehydrogenase [Mycoplana azooxidifex]